MTKDWYPTREAERRIFLQNFVNNIVAATALLGQPAGTYSAAADAAQLELDAIVKRDKARQDADTAQTELDDQSKLTATAMRAGANQIKNTMNVPQQVLDMLALVATPTHPNPRTADAPPVLKVKMHGIHPSIGCVKGAFDAVEIWCQRAEEAAPSRLAIVTHLPYFDNRPNVVPTMAEQRNYSAYYVKRNAVASALSPTYALLVPAGAHA